MANDKLLCVNLSLSCWLDQTPNGHLIKIRLVDKRAMKKVENAVEITAEPGAVGPQASRSYRIQEAIVVAMRRVVAEAIKEGLISVNPGPATTPRPATRPGAGIDITLSIEPDA